MNKPKRLASIGKQNAKKDPATHMVRTTITLRPDQVQIYKALGGVKWLRAAIDAQNREHQF